MDTPALYRLSRVVVPHLSEAFGLTCAVFLTNPSSLQLLYFNWTDPIDVHSIYGPGLFMNPGPAPRPPTDRPRLNTTPTIANLPGNMSQISLQSPVVRSVTNPPPSNNSSLSLSRSASLDSSGGLTIIKEGPARYKDDTLLGRFFNNKYLVLRQNQLDILKNQKDGKLTLSVQLKDVASVTRYDFEPLCIEISRLANPTTGPAVLIRDLPKKNILLQFKSEDELYDWMETIYNRCPTMSGVSNPTDFTHRIHVGFDSTNGNFVGLPPEWSKLLNASAITKADYERNPQAVFEVLEFYTDITKRNENPEQYPSLTPTPPVHTGQNMQLGHGGGGTSIAPPRPLPPGGLGRQASYQNQSSRVAQDAQAQSRAGTPTQTQRRPSGPDPRNDPYSANPSPESSQAKIAPAGDMRSAMEEEARRVKQQQQEQRDRQRVQDEAEQNRKDLEAYNAAIPKKSVPLVKQELGGYGSVEPSTRFNPTRAAPSAPSQDRPRQQTQDSLRQQVAQRQAPATPNGQVGSGSVAARPPFAQKTPPSRDQSPSNTQGTLRSATRPDQPQHRQPSPSTRQPGQTVERSQTPQTRAPTTGTQQTQPPTRLPGPSQGVKPLTFSTKAQPSDTTPAPQNSKPTVVVPEDKFKDFPPKPAETRQKEARMSSMSESEVMDKLKQIVTKQNPAQSYQKQKKIGQGASGSVYVAKVLSNAASPIAQSAYRKEGANCRVAIKTMDLRHQPRKELIVNEIIVMKESHHQNIVNYLDAFLLDDQNELWVVMEYMDAGALTDIIEANPVITEDQIAAICREVSSYTLSSTNLTNPMIDVQRLSTSTCSRHYPS